MCDDSDFSHKSQDDDFMGSQAKGKYAPVNGVSLSVISSLACLGYNYEVRELAEPPKEISAAILSMLKDFDKYKLPVIKGTRTLLPYNQPSKGT